MMEVGIDLVEVRYLSTSNIDGQIDLPDKSSV
jgi:hypothetical protein